MPPSEFAGAVLTIDLGAVARNYRSLRHRLGGTPCAGVVKGNAYGLGVAEIAPVLARQGCDSFFVATLDEAMELRGLLPDATIAVLNGVLAATAGQRHEDQQAQDHRQNPSAGQTAPFGTLVFLGSRKEESRPSQSGLKKVHFHLR